MKRLLMVLIAIGLAGCGEKQGSPAAPNAPASAREPAGMRMDEPEHLPTASDWEGASFPTAETAEVEQRVERDPYEPIRRVAPSPRVKSELALPAGMVPIAIAPSNTGPEVALLLKDPTGRTSVVQWIAGTDRTAPLGTLPEGFEGKSIARHPRTGAIFVAARSGGRSRIFAFGAGERSAAPLVVYESPREIGRLVVSARPFQDGPAGDGYDSAGFYRLFFAGKSADGSTSTRTITETGNVEYQVAGPESTIDSIQKIEEFAPSTVPAPFAAPTSVHPRGEPLLWQDQKGCTHLVRFDYGNNWHDDQLLRTIPCGALVRFPPNGRGYFAWTSGSPGIVLYDDSAKVGTPQAAQETFLISPALAADGRGVLGVAGRGQGQAAVVFVPIEAPLGDVVNAWQLAGNACDQGLFERSGGFLRDGDTAYYFPRQLYTLYEGARYGDGAGIPLLVTTDLFWENFAAAYNGVFILQERRRAIPAFNAFVTQTAEALGKSAPTSVWGKAFAALAAAQRGDSTGEAGLILHGEGTAHSTVLDDDFDFAELQPRGHYTTTPVMEKYFREVHYLTMLSSKRDPVVDVAPLRALPREVQRSAITWIEAYRSFIAPARAPLLWDQEASRTMAPFAKHPWDHPAAFPLSWGIDNEVLESTVFHEDWPADEQIGGPGGRRLHPSGVDVAAMFGNPLGRALLGADFDAYPRLRPVLDGVAARKPRTGRTTDLYQRWLDAMAVEWADSSSFPGAPAGSPVWNVKRLQTGLASWATLREATILVNERPWAAEMGEGGFEDLVPETPRGYVEPAPRTFEAIAGLYDALADEVAIPEDPQLQAGVMRRLRKSAQEVRAFGEMARKELRGEALTTREYNAISWVGGQVEHDFLLYKALADPELALSIPEPMGRIADVAGDSRLGMLEVAVGDPMEWHQLVPFFGRRQIAVGSVYSYYEFVSQTLYDNARWRREVREQPHPEWVRSVVAPPKDACRAASR